MKNKKLILGAFLLTSSLLVNAASVKITMNATSTTMSLAEKETSRQLELSEPKNKIYNFETEPGAYVLTAYGTDGTTVNGTIELNVLDVSEEQEFVIITPTAYVTNKNTDGSLWSEENGDFTFNIKVNTREGVNIPVTKGKSTTAGRYTFLAFNGNSYTASFVPSDEHQQEGYATLYRQGTLTANVNVYGAIPMASSYSVRIPEDADFYLGMKFSHFTNFTPVEPISSDIKDGTKTLTYNLSDGQVYNYRAMKKGGITHSGYFTMNSDASKRPELKFSEEDFNKYDPKIVNHDVTSNNGYETGDIFMNINPKGFLQLNTGDEYLLHCMRTWQATDNQTNNYFIEPEYHFTILDVNGTQVSDIVEIEKDPVSAWFNVKALGEGTAIVLVTYDALCLNYYSGATKSPYMGGELWGAIWPENTGVFVVNVGNDECSVVPNMLINQKYNEGLMKLAGENVDAEHDVFYYLDSQDSYNYIFKPENVKSVALATPIIDERTINYQGFTQILGDENGYYSIPLKHGRNIVRLTDNAGNSTYQVLTAKMCHRDITNLSREGSSIYQPGDKVKIQYSGLFHPSNKMAGIYNMSAYVTYNGVPNGSSLILGAGQYTFASAPSAQAVVVEIPENYDFDANPEILMSEGVIQVNGYGDPIGAHRGISPIAGRSPNFTAVAHKTYFGVIPDVNIKVTPTKKFLILIDSEVADMEVKVNFNGKEILPDEEGYYEGTYGNYSVLASKSGYRCYRHIFNIPDDADGLQTFLIEPVADENIWDGIACVEPKKNEENVYLISNGAELAWCGSQVNSVKGFGVKACLTNDIDLGDYDWTPIGASSTYPFSGSFDGNGFTVKGLYIDNPSLNYQGLFGYVKEAQIKNMEVDGMVSGSQYVAGIAAYVNANSLLDCCANHASVSGAKTYVGGVTGYLSVATAKLTNSFNTGSISGTTNCGGVIGSNNASAEIENIFNVGTVTGTKVGGCVGGTTAKTKVTNAYTLGEYGITDGQTSVSEERMRSGEIAFLLGDAFGQEIGVQNHPVLGGMKVYYDELSETYSNGETKIENVETLRSEDMEIYYNLQGMPSNTPWKGFNIIRKAGGEIKKTYIK